jgi:aminoglycoside 6'-N-acetyltransferase I
VIIRTAQLGDLDAIASMSVRLWPESPAHEHREEVRALLAGEPLSTMPLTMFVAEDEARVIGFIEVGLRSHADGCDPRQPCGFVEGWFVEPEHRRRGVGRRLIEHAESWARRQGCIELASDTWLDNAASQNAHAALGFEVVDRCVNYRKPIARSQ